jgi:hypothetical protein
VKVGIWSLFVILAAMTLAIPAAGDAQEPQGTGTLDVSVRQAGEAETKGGPYHVVIVSANQPDLLTRPDQKNGVFATDVGGRLIREGLAPGEYIVAPLIPHADTAELTTLRDFDITFEQGPLALKGTVVSVQAGKTAVVEFVRRENPRTDVKPPDTGHGQTPPQAVGTDEHSSVTEGGTHTAWAAVLYSGIALIAGSSASLTVIAARRRLLR